MTEDPIQYTPIRNDSYDFKISNENIVDISASKSTFTSGENDLYCL